MSRQKKPPPETTDWREYKPTQARYWFYGGPWVPVDKIPASDAYRPENILRYEKPPTRAKSVAKLLAEDEALLPKAVAQYLDLHERGAEALPWEWARKEMAEGRWDRSKPNHLHYALNNAYSDITTLRGRIAAYEAVLASIEPAKNPLFHWKKG